MDEVDKSIQGKSTIENVHSSQETADDASQGTGRLANDDCIELQVLQAPPTSFRQSNDIEDSNNEHPNTRRIQHRHSDAETFSYSIFSFLLDAFSIITYLADVGSDIWVAVLYYKDGDWWWFSLTIAFVSFPCFYMGASSLFQSCRDKDSCAHVIFTIIVTTVPGGPVILYVWIIIQEMALKNTKDKSRKQELYEETISNIAGLASLRLIEAFMEAAPQLVLQLHIICLGHGSTKPIMVAVQWASVGTSLGSLSWAVVAFKKSRRMEEKRALSSYFGLFLQFLWRVFIIAARVVSLSLFASSLNYGVFILAAVHLLAMDIWLVMQSTTCGRDSLECASFLSYLPLAFVHIFCDLFLKGGHTRLRYALYYTLVYLENGGMLFAWHVMTQTTDVWFRYPAFVVVLGGFFLGVFFQVIYYLRCHHTSTKEHHGIKLCIPYSDLSCI